MPGQRQGSAWGVPFTSNPRRDACDNRRKKIEIKNAIPVVMPAMPVFASSAMPVDDSTNSVTGDVPKRAPIKMQNPSTQ